MRWGSGSLQEIDHLPFVDAARQVAPTTVKETGDDPARHRGGDRHRREPRPRPDLRRLPARRRLHGGRGRGPARGRRRRRAVADGAEEAGELLAAAERPVIMAGTNLYWARGEDELRALAEALGIPVFLNGMGRGCLPADHELGFSRARGAGLKGGDVALVDRRPARLPARLRRRRRRGREADPARLRRRAARGDPPARPRPGRRHRRHPGRDPRVRRPATPRGPPGVGRASCARSRPRSAPRRRTTLDDDRSPLHPMRVYRELASSSTATRS